MYSILTFNYCVKYFLESSYESVSNCLDEFAKQTVDEEAVNASTFQGIIYSVYLLYGHFFVADGTFETQ